MRESKKYSIFDILFYITWAISILTSFHFGHHQKDCLKPIDIEIYRKEKNVPMVVISGLPG